MSRNSYSRLVKTSHLVEQSPMQRICVLDRMVNWDKNINLVDRLKSVVKGRKWIDCGLYDFSKALFQSEYRFIRVGKPRKVNRLYKQRLQRRWKRHCAEVGYIDKW